MPKENEAKKGDKEKVLGPITGDLRIPQIYSYYDWDPFSLKHRIKPDMSKEEKEAVIKKYWDDLKINDPKTYKKAKLLEKHLEEDEKD